MSVSGISSSSFADYSQQASQGKQIQQEFEQLGQDLQAGNLSAAQSDFAALQQLIPQGANAQAQSNNPIAQAFHQLAQDLQAGNLSGAQQDYTQIQQDFQAQAQQSPETQAHHHRHGGGGSGDSAIGQLIAQLGQALQSGNLSAAQQEFSALQADLRQAGIGGGESPSSSPAGPNSVSVNA